VTGSFAGPYAQGSYLSITLVDSQGVVVGNGWTTVGGPVRHLLINGTSTPNLSLQLIWDNNVDGIADSGLVAWTLSGHVQGPGIAAQLTIPGFPPSTVSLERTDTAASGTYTWTTQGAIALNERGPAGFELQLPNTLGLTLPGEPFDEGIRLDVYSGRPQPGEYPIAPYPSPVVAAVFHQWRTGGNQYWQATTGVLSVDVSTAYALIGHFSFTATKPTGTDTILVSGSFSAGCWAVQCQ
jgi:hypothetical protein